MLSIYLLADINCWNMQTVIPEQDNNMKNYKELEIAKGQ